MKFNKLIPGLVLITALNSNVQAQWLTNSTTIYNNPTTNSISLGTNAVPPAGIKLDIASGTGNLRLNGNQLLFHTDNFHGIGFFGSANYFTMTGPYANTTIDGPVLYGYTGGALGTSQFTGKNIALSWKHDGRVGIGIYSPTARLHIVSPVSENSLDITYQNVCNFRVNSAGYVYARDITVQTGTFPDYVFSKEYKLMSLYDVRSFIQKNHHLPEMPTASEVSENGMSVSKINTLLVQKVEELTLYVIRLQEEIDQLKKQP